MCCHGVEKADVIAQGGEMGVRCGGKQCQREWGRGGHEGRGTLHGGQGAVSLGIGKWRLHRVGGCECCIGWGAAWVTQDSGYSVEWGMRDTVPPRREACILTGRGKGVSRRQGEEWWGLRRLGEWGKGESRCQGVGLARRGMKEKN